MCTAKALVHALMISHIIYYKMLFSSLDKHPLTLLKPIHSAVEKDIFLVHPLTMSTSSVCLSTDSIFLVAPITSKLYPLFKAFHGLSLPQQSLLIQYKEINSHL